MAAIDYKRVAFCLVRPPSKVVATRRIKNRAEHADLLKEAGEKSLLIYYAAIEWKSGKYLAKQPWLLDRSTLENIGGEEVVEDEPVVSAPTDELRCPYCNKAMNSTPGRTLHIKSKHPEKLAEYLQLER